MLQLLQQSIKTSEDLTSALRFDKRSELARTIISLYLTIIEQCDSQVALIKLGKYAGVEAIFRSTLEAYIDLVNLIKDDAFLDHMKASHSDQWIKLAKEAMNGGNDFLATFSKTPENEQILADHEGDIKAFKERGIHPLTVKQRFERAGKGDMYTSVYNSLCAETHNNIRALNERHIKMEEDDFQVILYNEPEQESKDHMLDRIVGTLCIAGLEVHGYFGSSAEQPMRIYFARLQELRAKAQRKRSFAHSIS